LQRTGTAAKGRNLQRWGTPPSNRSRRKWLERCRLHALKCACCRRPRMRCMPRTPQACWAFARIRMERRRMQLIPSSHITSSLLRTCLPTCSFEDRADIA
jgi:hypothetical protein